MGRILLLMHTETYRATDFMAAAAALGLDVVVGLSAENPLEDLARGGTVALDFTDVERGVEGIVSLHERQALSAVVSVDDSATVLAARASARLGLAANPEEGVVAGGNKTVFREITQAAGLRTPWFRQYPLASDPAPIAAEVPYPCVLKPLFLNASRGVIRADDPAAFTAAFHRIRTLLSDPEVRQRGGAAADFLLVEAFVPGREVALEGMIHDGSFRLLAFFDKPDPLDGPFFEETLYITPSRHPQGEQIAALRVAAEGARALGLRTGPVHAELRLDGGEPFLLEIAPRSIGGHCSRTLRFGAGMSLEELILRQALGISPEHAERETAAAGVMMIPIPGKGMLEAVHGIEEARAVPGIEDVEITIPLHHEVVPLPEGARYLGFIFARGPGPQEVESALRAAHALLSFDLSPA